MELEKGNVVLEVCTGTCRNIALFAGLVKGIYIGVDASLGMLKQCPSNLGGDSQVGLVLGFAENLPFRDEVFDRVLIGECLGHITYKEKALREAYRVLKPGGLLVVYDQTTYLDRLLGRIYKIFEQRPRELVLTSFRYLYGGHIYIARFIKT